MSSTPTAVRDKRPPLPLIFTITLTGITVNTLIAPSIPEILAAFGAPAQFAGLVLAAATLPGIVLAPVIGLLADRHGRRTVLVPSLVLFGVAGGLIAAAPALWVVVALRFLQGIGSAALINLAVVVIGDHWEGAERARVIGRNAAVLTAGLALFPVVGGFLTDIATWRAPFLVYPFALVSAFVVAQRLPAPHRRDVGLRGQLREALPVLRSIRVVGILAASTLTFLLIFGLLLTILPIYLQTRFGLGATVRGLLLSLPALTNSAVALSLGRLRRAVTARTLVASAAGVLAAGLAAIALAPTVGVLVAAVLLFGVGEGLMIPNLQDLATGTAPGAVRGTVVAFFVSAARLGQTLGPVLAGFGLSLLGAAGTFAVGAVLAAALAVAAATVARPQRAAAR